MTYEEFKAKINVVFRKAQVIGNFDYDEEKGLYIAYSSDETLITCNRSGKRICFKRANGFKTFVNAEDI